MEAPMDPKPTTAPISSLMHSSFTLVLLAYEVNGYNPSVRIADGVGAGNINSAAIMSARIDEHRKHSIIPLSTESGNWSAPIKLIQAIPGMHQYQPAYNPDFVKVPNNQLPRNQFPNAQFSNNQLPMMERYNNYQHGHHNGHFPTSNGSFVNAQGAQPSMGGHSSYSQCEQEKNAVGYGGFVGEPRYHTAKLIPEQHRGQVQNSNVGRNTKKNPVFPHLPDSVLRDCRTNADVLTPYQISAAKFLFITAPHMFQIGIMDVAKMIDQWDNQGTQSTGNSNNSGNGIWSNGNANGRM